MISIDRFFDIETENWDSFVLGGVADAGGGYQSFRDELDLFHNLLERGGEVWSWNGGLYDLIWFIGVGRREGVPMQISTAGPRVTRVTVGGLTMRDALALCPMRLAKAARIAGIELDKETGLPCVCDGEPCGGYCSISRYMPERHYRALDRYLRLDCETGLAIVEALIAEAERCGYELTGTVGGSAWKTARATLDIEPEDWTSAHYAFARRAYYGGRTEVFRPAAPRGHAYDLNSAYPAALATISLPVGPRLECDAAKAKRAYARGIDGIFVCRVEVPTDMFLPPLPTRLISGRVAYAVGPIAGHWTARELREAESLGCDVSIDGALLWADAAPVMADMMRAVFANRARARAEGNPTLAEWHKWFGNSYTGKLAEAPDKDRVLLHPRADKMIACHARDCRGKCREGVCCPHRCTRRCGAWRPLDRRGTLWSAPFWRLSDSSLVHWAAMLTSHTRIELRRQLAADGQGGASAVYCDTDSCFSTEPRARNLGDELGQWGSDGPFEDFFAIAPKAYRYRRDGREVCKAKGLSGITVEDFQRFVDGEPIYRDRGVMGLRSAARAGGELFRRKRLIRSSHADGKHYGSRVLGNDGRTYPQTIAEVSAWEKHRQSERS